MAGEVMAEVAVEQVQGEVKATAQLKVCGTKWVRLVLAQGVKAVGVDCKENAGLVPAG